MKSLSWVVIVMPLVGCGAERRAPPTDPSAPAAITIAGPAVYAVGGPDRVSSSSLQSRQRDPLTSVPVAGRLRQSYLGQGFAADAPLARPPRAIPVKPAASRLVEQVEIEAKIQLESAELERARTGLIRLVEAFDGQLMNEAVEDSEASRGASFSLRIPSARVRQFLARLPTLGKLRSSSLETREVSRTLNDADVVRRNLEQALARYEELLAKAANVGEATTLEAELQRVRSELDRVTSDLAWSRDRVARSTVYVTLLPPSSYLVAPRAKLYPGVRAALLVDFPPSPFAGHPTAFAGGGLSFKWNRVLDTELDLLKDLSRSSGGAVNFYVLSLGTTFYSDYLGGGKRRTLNPYFGFRAGYAHAARQSLLALGGALGVELYQSERLQLSLDTRLYAMLGRKHGADFAIGPSLGLNIAY